jgi:hypothetical protein
MCHTAVLRLTGNVTTSHIVSSAAVSVSCPPSYLNAWGKRLISTPSALKSYPLDSSIPRNDFSVNAVSYCSYPTQQNRPNVQSYADFRRPYHSPHAFPTSNIGIRSTFSPSSYINRTFYQPRAPIVSQTPAPLSFVTRVGCPGARLEWGPSFFTTYPFSIHDPGCKEFPGYHLQSIGPDPSATMIVSKRCKGQPSDDGGACSSCVELSVDVDLVRHRATCAGGAVKSHLGLANELQAQKDEKKKLNLKVRQKLCHSIVYF